MIELTDEYKEMIEMWKKGATSSELAKHFGVTRNTIMGRLNRLRIAGFVEYKKQPPLVPIPAKQRKEEQKEFINIFFKKKEEVQASKENISFMELKHSSCRYVVSGEKASEFMFCGKQIWKKSYCEHHHKICMFPSAKRTGKGNPFIIQRNKNDLATKPSPSNKNS
jgi:hypothetical protein